MKRTKQKNGIWAFFLYPLLFAGMAVLLLSVSFGPAVSPYIGLSRYFFAQSVPHTSPNSLAPNLSEQLATQGTISQSQIEYPTVGVQYGTLRIENAMLEAPLFYGDTAKCLNNGVGTYVDSSGAGIPGESKTVLVAGHNTTFFNGLQDVKEGDIVSLETNYGSYTYRVIQTKIAKATDTDTYDFTKKEENLILYTCYPFDAFGLTPERYFVYAEYVSGPKLEKDM